MWHALRFPTGANSEFAAASLELLKNSSRRLILTTLAVYLSWHLFLTVSWPQRVGWTAWLLASFFVVASAVPLRMLPRHPGAALCLWHLGLAVAILSGIQVFQRPEVALLFALLPFAAVVTLGWPAGLITGILVAALMATPDSAPFLGSLTPEQRWIVLLGGGFTALLGWTAQDTLLAVTGWSLESFAQAQENTEGARSHRAQLAIALKDLDQAYYRLGRTNAALVAAWKAADEAERFKAEFVANVSHELRTPLNLVIGFSEMMMTAPESYGGVLLPGAYRSDLNAIYHSARHLLSLVDDVLDLARIDAGHMALAREQVDLAELVAEATEIVRNYITAKGLELRVRVSSRLPPVWVDRLRIRQVLLNLLVNATRFSDRGWISIDASLRDGEVLVRVIDTGRGIPEQDLPKIFEEFRTTEQPVSTWHSGTGLGLPICKKYVELHDGRIGVESAYGERTTFWFTLPLRAAAHPASPPRRGRTRPVVPSEADERTVIVVHEDSNIVRLLQRFLDGYRLVEASDPQEALRLAEEIRPVAMLTDVSKAAALEAAGLPVIACPLPSGRQAAAAIGADDLLVKPVSHQELLQAIDRLGRPIRRILIADDDPNVVRLFQRMLRTRFPSEDCLEAYNGKEALARLKAEKPDLLLLDLAMPQVDGRGVLERMTADPELREIPTIIVSAKSQDYINLELPGPIQIRRARGFGLGEVVRTLEAVLNLQSMAWTKQGSNEPVPGAAPAASQA